jgi:plasmid stabilization system protein ParE
MYKVIVLDQAFDDIKAAADNLDGYSFGLGRDLVIEFAEALKRLEQFPLASPMVEDGIRRFYMPRFEYIIYFRVSSDTVQIFAVYHARRKPLDFSN